MYMFFVGGCLLPIAPAKITTNINNQNKTINLINDGEINLIKSAGLTTIEFDALLPRKNYSFVHEYIKNGTIELFIQHFNSLKEAQKPFQFIIVRNMDKGDIYESTNICVTLEEFTTIEDASNGCDVLIKIKLKEYKTYGTKFFNVNAYKDTFDTNTNTVTTVVRESNSSPAPTGSSSSYTVVKGDCLWNIAKHFYGDGSKYPTIYDANKSLIDGDNAGTGNTVYTIYPNQVFTIPAI